jgi:Cdc6-like AAA superfamily ATPase
MDPVRNPFAPGAGTPPPELAGRSELLGAGLTAFRRIALRRPTQSVIMVGLRGVGKTVLLNKLNDQAEQEKL